MAMFTENRAFNTRGDASEYPSILGSNDKFPLTILNFIRLLLGVLSWVSTKEVKSALETVKLFVKQLRVCRVWRQSLHFVSVLSWFNSIFEPLSTPSSSYVCTRCQYQKCLNLLQNCSLFGLIVLAIVWWKINLIVYGALNELLFEKHKQNRCM